MSKDVAVLGCGPAGLLVAQAVYAAGGIPFIYSKKVKSEIPGSLHLRQHIPDVTAVYPDNIVTVVRMGTATEYARKVYGDPERYTGWDNYAQTYPSWDAVRAYDELWDRFQGVIQNRVIEDGEDLLDIQRACLLTISTLPAQGFCYRKHSFEHEPYWIKTLPTPPEDRGREIIVYNGMARDKWYRYTILGGICALEGSGNEEPRQDGSIRNGVKPTHNNCDCYPLIVRAGRWAEWRHGVLLHDAYWRAYNATKEALLVGASRG